jgi:16S rRNA (cytidine1402-2'-O)-methyltransferase
MNPSEKEPAGSASEDEVDPEVLEELETWSGPDGTSEPPPEHEGTVAGDDDGNGVPGMEVAGDGPPVSRAGGAVVLVGTPIGNLGDLSPRAVEALAGADVIYCEDTRHSRKLLTHAGITGASLRSLHEHNEEDRIAGILRSVGEGRTVAVVSDAGMPGISDPGSRVVAAAAEAGLTVTVVPGPSAVLAALVASGLATDRFCFEGFLPRSGRDRKERMASVAAEPRTTVLFEAPGRVAATVRDLADACGGDRRVAVARELTKLHEEIWRGTLAEAAAWADLGPVRGEVVLVVAGAPDIDEPEVDDDTLSAALAERLAAGERTRGVVDDVAAAFEVTRRRVYELALAVRAADGAPVGDAPRGDQARSVPPPV